MRQSVKLLSRAIVKLNLRGYGNMTNAEKELLLEIRHRQKAKA